MKSFFRSTAAAGLLAALAGIPPCVPAADWLPVLVRLEGVGAIYGLAGGVRDLGPDGPHLYAAATGGSVEGTALLLRDWRPGDSKLRVHLFAGQVIRAELVTSYTRGTVADRPVHQELAATGMGAALELGAEGAGLGFQMGLAQTTVALGDFETEGGETIPLPQANLHDVTTTNLLLGLNWSNTDNLERPTRGVNLGAALLAQTGRIAQSDVLTRSLRATATLPLGSSLVAAVHLRTADAEVLSGQTAYDTPAEVAAALGVDCASVSDATERSRCGTLAAEQAAFIAASNRRGTAPPLGGSTSLRGYREFRFRAAHTRLAAAEMRWRLGGAGEWAVFTERGWAADTVGALEERLVHSAGMELRWWLGDLPVRLGGADGDEGGAWYLTAGRPW